MSKGAFVHPSVHPSLLKETAAATLAFEGQGVLVDEFVDGVGAFGHRRQVGHKQRVVVVLHEVLLEFPCVRRRQSLT